MIRRLLDRVPQLRASEAIADVTRVQIGTGHMEQGTAQGIVRGWERDANKGWMPSGEVTGQLNPKGFVSPGMRVILVPKKEPNP